MTPEEERVIQLLKQQLRKIDELKNESKLFNSPIFMEWKNNISTVIRRIFGENSHEYANFSGIRFASSIVTFRRGIEQHRGGYLHGLDKAAAQLRSIITIIETMGMED